MTLLQFSAAGMVVTVRNPVKSALFLVLAFFSAACVWITLQAEFLAIVLVLVYVGAVMVLFLFVVMMLDIDLARLRAGFARYLPVGGLIAALLAAEIVLVIHGTFPADLYSPPIVDSTGHSNTKALGSVLYTHYVYAFEIAALILLVAIVAAIALTMRKRPGTKYTHPGRQVKVRREDRLKLISMKAEGKSAQEGTT